MISLLTFPWTSVSQAFWVGKHSVKLLWLFYLSLLFPGRLGVIPERFQLVSVPSFPFSYIMRCLCSTLLQTFLFPDLSLIKIKFSWPKKCEIAGLVAVSSSTCSLRVIIFNKVFFFIEDKCRWDQSDPKSFFSTLKSYIKSTGLNYFNFLWPFFKISIPCFFPWTESIILFFGPFPDLWQPWQLWTFHVNLLNLYALFFALSGVYSWLICIYLRTLESLSRITT